MRSVQGGHTTQNLLFRFLPKNLHKNVSLKQIVSELWHVSHAVKPGILGLSSASHGLTCAGHGGTSLAEAFSACRPVGVQRARGAGT